MTKRRVALLRLWQVMGDYARYSSYANKILPEILRGEAVILQFNETAPGMPRVPESLAFFACGATHGRVNHRRYEQNGVTKSETGRHTKVFSH